MPGATERATTTKRQPEPTRSVSIDRMLQSLERTLRAERKSEKTIYSYSLSVRLLVDWLKEHDRPTTVDVSRDDIREFIAEQGTPRTMTDSLGRSHRSGSPATALVRYKSLQQFFRHCVEEDELPISPMAGMRSPEVKDVPVPIVDDDALGKLLKTRSGTSLTDRRDTALLRIFLDTGCRLAEVTNLRQGDVNNGLQRLTVRGKGDRVRVVQYGAKTGTAIDRYLRQLEREMPRRIGDDLHLWVGRQGPLSSSGITNTLHRMCDDAKIKRLHWHQLRHTYAHVWLLAGGNEGELMEQAGWQSRAMLDRYAKSARVERAHSAARRLSLGDRI